MDTSTKVAFALVILMGFGSFPANALVPGQCTPWKSVLGGACKARKCAVGESPAIHLVPETVCPPPPGGSSIPLRPIIMNGQIIPGTSRGSTVLQ